MIVYFFRHASAGAKRANASADTRRPLDSEGIAQCGYMGRSLAALNAHVDVIISSPFKRASQTAALVGNEIGHEGKIQFDDALRPDATFEAFRDLLDRHRQDEAIMVVGHNPSMSNFLSLLVTGGSSRNSIEMKKGSVAKVELGGPRRPAVLKWSLTPKVVRTLHESSGTKSRPKSSRK
ncbi:MAG: phosphohistidine phosphatase SixA [Candidatus Korobacteraceae bacterium]